MQLTNEKRYIEKKNSYIKKIY